MKPADEFMQPLLHIGYHKTGTTWLQRYVFPNAEAGFCKVAKPKALDAAFIQANPFVFEPQVVRKEFESGIREAQVQNLVPVLSYERLSGNPHSGGYDSKSIADGLAATFPEARILLVIREQTSMLVSLYKHYVKRGGAGSFQQYVTMPPGSGRRVPTFRFDFLEYHRLIGYYQGLFGVENVLVLPYELLEARPEAFLERLGKFLSVPAARSGFQRANVSLSALILSLKRHANRCIVRDALNPAPPVAFSGSNDILLRWCGKMDERLPRSLREGYERRWRRYAEREVGTRYAESNTLTAKLTGIGLQALGYACER